VPPSSHWLVPLALFVVLGLAASLYIFKSRLPHEARAAGLRMLGTLPWTDFIQLVLAVLNGRGYERSFGGAGTEGEYLLERGGQKWLLSSRHSRAWKPGTTGIAEFAAHLRHQGLEGGILAIPGRFPPAAFSVGKAHRIELVDGPTMWDELSPVLADEQHRQIEQAARRRVRSQFALAWGGALLVALLVGMAWKDVGGAQAPAVPVAEAAPPTTGETVATAQAPEPASTPIPDPAVATPTTPAGTLIPVEERRLTIAKAVDELPHVTGAHWPSPSTLQVQVDSEAFDPHTLCPLLEADPDLGASRLQVQYPAGSDRAIRFLQCRAY
jgi:hypothetical protein